MVTLHYKMDDILRLFLSSLLRQTTPIYENMNETIKNKFTV